MKKKENEFAKTLDQLEVEVQIRNQKKTVESRRLKKVEVILEKKKEEKEKLQLAETEVARKGEIRDKLGILISIGCLVAIYIYFNYGDDPVNFWFNVIAGLCFFSIYIFKKYSK